MPAIRFGYGDIPELLKSVRIIIFTRIGEVSLNIYRFHIIQTCKLMKACSVNNYTTIGLHGEVLIVNYAGVTFLAITTSLTRNWVVFSPWNYYCNGLYPIRGSLRSRTCKEYTKCLIHKTRRSERIASGRSQRQIQNDTKSLFISE